MPFEPDKVSRTLIIERGVMAGKKVFALHPFMRVTTLTGEVYQETVPYELFVQGSRDVYLFDEVEFIDSPATKMDVNANMINLTNMQGQFAVRRTA